VRYDPTIYDGAAVHYRYGRSAYSPGLEALLTKELGLDGSGRLLDVGCGPGILTVRLAGLFKEAVGWTPIRRAGDVSRAHAGRRAHDPGFPAARERMWTDVLTGERFRQNRVAVAERDDELAGIAMSGPPDDVTTA